jgi:prolyl-tRNA synthetase
VPIRIELGPRDVASGELVAVRRDTGEKLTLKVSSAADDIKKLLDDIHNSMHAKWVFHVTFYI